MTIAVASGKGGTGKTTLSVNLAYMLAEQAEFQRLILADLDVEEPNSGIFVDGKVTEILEMNKYIPEWDADKCTSCGSCEKLCRFNAVLGLGKTIMIIPELCHSCYACSELCPAEALTMVPRRMGELRKIDAVGFTFIESRLDIGQEQAVPLISQSIAYVEKTVSESPKSETLILYDSPPGSSCPVMETAKNSDFILLVTEPTPFGLHDLKLAAGAMTELKKEYAVVLNRAGIGNDEVVRYCIENGIRIIAEFPNMRRVAELYSSGRLIYPEVPEFRATLDDVSDFIYGLSGRRKK